VPSFDALMAERGRVADLLGRAAPAEREAVDA
jgi:hypothetical protein